MIKNIGQIVDSSRESLSKMVAEMPDHEHYELHIGSPRGGNSASLVDMVGRLVQRELDLTGHHEGLIYDPIVTTGLNTLVANICPEDGQLRVIFTREK